MPSTLAITVFFVCIGLNNNGEYVFVDKSALPPGYTSSILANLESCNVFRGRLDHPEKYTCQRFVGPKTTTWTPDRVGPITPEEAAGTPAAPEIKASPTGLKTPETDPPEKGYATVNATASTTLVDEITAAGKTPVGKVVVGPNNLQDKDKPFEPAPPPKKEVAKRRQPSYPINDLLAFVRGDNW